MTRAPQARPQKKGHDESMPPWTIEPVATVQSPFQEKFGIPRQSGMTSLHATLKLNPARVTASALQGLHEASHLWLIFGFHAIEDPAQASTVRPPRLGGNQRTGVYGTRSPFRPNRLGLSLVQLHAVQDMSLEVSGADLLDQTPVFDIKPFVPYCDIPQNPQHWAQSAPQELPVRPSQALAQKLDQSPVLKELWSKIQDYLRWDPRPSYRPVPDPKVYRQRFCDHELSFRRNAEEIVVDTITPSPGAGS